MLIMMNFYPMIFNKIKFHPINLNIMLILYSSMICSYIFIYLINAIYSFMIFLIMTGGLFILFLYFTSLCPNKYFHSKLNLTLLMFFMSLMLFNSMNLNLLYNNSVNMEIYNLNFINKPKMLNPSILIFTHPYSLLTTTLILMLLIYLILIIKIIKFNMSLNSMRMIKSKNLWKKLNYLTTLY